MASPPGALVLTWNSTVLRVQCPYKCDAGIHCHNWSGRRVCLKRRVRAPCKLNIQAGMERTYRIVFPFADDPLTEGLWWMPDLTLKRWRTIGVWMDDPDYISNDEKGLLPSTVLFEDLTYAEDESRVSEPGSSSSEEDSNDEDSEEGDRADGGEKKRVTCDRRDGQAQQDGVAPHKTEKREGKTQNHEENEPVSEVDELQKALGALEIQEPTSRDEKAEFDAYCLRNAPKEARSMLEKSKIRHRLLHNPEITSPDYKPILIALCERGHKETVDMILEYLSSIGMELDELAGADDALREAIKRGFGRIANSWIRAGASIEDSGGKPLLILARKALEQRMEKSRNNTEGQAGQRTLAGETSALAHLVKHLERWERGKSEARIRRRIENLHGVQQAQYAIRERCLSESLIRADKLEKLHSIPTSSPEKTKACLTLCDILPYCFAVSGYVHGEKGTMDGALDRPRWTKRVFKLAQVLGHYLCPSDWDHGREPGSSFACHVEKQLLAYMLWNHTTVLWDLHDAVQADLDRCKPPSLKHLRAEIIISNAQKTAHVCNDCHEFLQKAADKFDMDIQVYVAFGEELDKVKHYKRE